MTQKTLEEIVASMVSFERAIVIELGKAEGFLRSWQLNTRLWTSHLVYATTGEIAGAIRRYSSLFTVKDCPKKLGNLYTLSDLGLAVRDAIERGAV